MWADRASAAVGVCLANLRLVSSQFGCHSCCGVDYGNEADVWQASLKRVDYLNGKHVMALGEDPNDVEPAVLNPEV